MKIAFNAATIEEIVDAVALSVRSILTKKISELEEQELLAEIRADKALSTKGKIITYLRRTKHGLTDRHGRPEIAVRSEYIRHGLSIPPPTMKRAREELKRDRTIAVSGNSHSPLTLHYSRAKVVPASKRDR